MMKEIHSNWAYLVLLMLAFAVINALLGLSKKRAFTDKDMRIGLFTLIVSHIQLLIGFAWYFMSPYFKALTTNAKEVMGDSAARLLAVEHPLTMIIAIALITIGWSKHKTKTKDSATFKTFAIFYGLALLLIFSRIPWSNWLQF